MARLIMLYYRETGKYLECTSKWVERLGLENIKKVLEDKERCMQLTERLEETMRRYKEPWQETIESAERQDKYYNRVNVPVENY